MNKKKLLEIAINTAVFVIPFGLVAIGGYYGYKKYRKNKDDKKELESKQTEKDNNGG